MFETAVCTHQLVLAILFLESTALPKYIVAYQAGSVSTQGSSKRGDHLVRCLAVRDMTVPEGAFSFDLCKRNTYLEARGVKAPGYTKTGTTIAGIIFKVS